MARSAVAKKPTPSQPPPVPEEPTPRFAGEKPTLKPIGLVKPNDWNPNEFTPEMLESLKYGLLHDGWLLSQSLLVWGTDDKGVEQNVIIDGEHRWKVAQELGFKQAPMVFLQGLTAAQAKALTIKVDAKRGKFNPVSLAELVREIQLEMTGPDLAIDLGFGREELMGMLDTPDLPLDTPAPKEEGQAPGTVPSGMGQHVKMVQLFFNAETHAEFTNLVKKLAPGFDTKDVSDTTLEALRRASLRTAEKPNTERRASRR